jgi:phosphohistidine swiveling domain-containing protein
MSVHPFHELSRSDLSSAGGKGANLAEMIRHGIPVPPGFVVSADAYATQAREWKLAERLAPHLAKSDWEATAKAAEEIFLGGAVLPDIESAVLAAYRELGAPPVAVRSSATAEDLADASFAGQQETYLDVVGEAALLLALRRCWASLWGARALHYRASRGIDHLGVNIAVVVQRMVRSEHAGVLFTVDPVAQRADRMLLEVAPGLGEAVVSGHTTGDVYHLRREPFAGASGAGERKDASSGALSIEARERRDPDRPAPSDALILDLARLGLRLEAHFGCPQDVEFAFAEGSVYLLQSRPITTLGAAEIEPIPPLPELTRVEQVLAKLNSDDRFPIAPKPLDRWVLGMMAPVFAHMMRFLGFDVDEAETKARMTSLWTEVMLPPPGRLSPRLLRLPWTVAGSLRQDWLAWWESEGGKRLEEACAPVDIRALDDEALLGRADRIAETATSVMKKRFEGIAAQMSTGLLQLAATFTVGKERAGAVVGDLLSGLFTRTSEVNLALFLLARKGAEAGPEVTSAIREERPDDLRASEAGQAFLAEVEAFLNEHGHRESVGLYLSTPMWRTDPTPMWGLLRAMLDTTEPPSEEAGLERYRVAREEVSRKLRAVPGLLPAFDSVLDNLRRAILFRERSHFDLSRIFTALQEIVAELARRFCERGLLKRPDDIFYLTKEELWAWARGAAPPEGERTKLLERRRATYQVVNGRWQKRAFGVGAGAGVGGAGSTGDELRGIGASSGVVRGKARVVLREQDFGRLKPGEILVCPYTNPAWTPLFSIAAGVVTNVGGAVSHAAIVAREHGIPAVLGALGATERIQDGQEIVVDGAEGRVKLLPLAPAAHG